MRGQEIPNIKLTTIVIMELTKSGLGDNVYAHISASGGDFTAHPEVTGSPSFIEPRNSLSGEVQLGNVQGELLPGADKDSQPSPRGREALLRAQDWETGGFYSCPVDVTSKPVSTRSLQEVWEHAGFCFLWFASGGSWPVGPLIY